MPIAGNFGAVLPGEVKAFSLTSVKTLAPATPSQR
jgi:hypothetical protein